MATCKKYLFSYKMRRFTLPCFCMNFLNKCKAKIHLIIRNKRKPVMIFEPKSDLQSRPERLLPKVQLSWDCEHWQGGGHPKRGKALWICTVGDISGT